MRSAMVLFLAVTVAVLLRGPLGEANARRRALELPVLPSPKLAKVFALGHRSTLADSLWLRSVPDFSQRFARADEPDSLAKERKQKWLEDVVDVITALEPKFHTVYSYASAYLQLVSQEPERAIEVLERGARENPDDIELMIHLGMALLTQRHDREGALAVFRKVVDHPAADPWSLGLCSRLLVDEREDVAALEQYHQYLDSQDEYTKEMAELLLERTRRQLAVRAKGEFEAREGRPIASLDELRDPRLLTQSVQDEVLGAARFEEGRLWFPRAEELELRSLSRLVRRFSQQFREENGRWPNLEDLKRARNFSVPRLPGNRRIELVEGELVVVDG